MALSASTGAAAGGAGQGGGELARTDKARLKRLESGVTQLEARMRAVEASTFMHIQAKPVHLAVTKGQEAYDAYMKYVTAVPEGQTHDAGSPHCAIGVQALAGLCLQPLNGVVDDGLKARKVCLTILVCEAMAQSPDAVNLWMDHFAIFVAPGYQGREAAAKISYKLVGEISLPEDMDLDYLLPIAEAVLGGADPTELLSHARRSYTWADGVPVPTTRGFQIGLIVRSLFCSSGGTKPSGKATRAPWARAMKGKGKGK